MQKQNLKKTLCIVAGGSGGHITPALSLGKEWLLQQTNGHILFFSNKQKLDTLILSQSQLSETQTTTFKLLRLMKMPTRKLYLFPLFFLQLLGSFCYSFFHLLKQRPEKILSTGGLLAIPICLAGKILKIPIELHELNVIPGKATTFLAPLTNKIFITFQESKKHFANATVRPYPLRFSMNDKLFDRKEIISQINTRFSPHIQFHEQKKTIFLLGGSQGSQFLNDLLYEWTTSTSHSNIQVIHQTGGTKTFNWEEFYTTHNIPAITFSYDHHIKDFYLLADILITRGGAGTLFELQFFDKKSIIIPLKQHAGNHQVANALAIANQNPDLFTLLDQDELKVKRSPFDAAMEKIIKQ